MKEKRSSRTIYFMRPRIRGVPLAALVVALTLVPTLLAQPAGAAAPRTGSHAQTFSTSSSPWHIQTTPVLKVKEGEFDGISCASATYCAAIGFGLDSADDDVALSEAWNGTSWSMMKGASPSGVTESALSGVDCVSASDCLAVGQADEGPLAEQWNGASWKVENVPTSAIFAILNGVSCASRNNCMAVGTALEQTENGFVQVALAEEWNGTAWTEATTAKIAESPAADFESVSCLSDGACEAVGNYQSDSGEPAVLAESWSGERWVLQKTPAVNSGEGQELNGVSCVSASDCIAVGSALPDSLAESWNGSHWSVVTTPTPSGSEGSELFGVSCTSRTSCMIAGGYANSAGVDRTLAISWNGKTGKIEPTLSPSPTESGFLGVTCTAASACTAVGGSVTAKNPSLLLVEVWDGTTWSTQHLFQKRSPVGAALFDVSCTSVSFCIAVGSDALQNPIAEEWNGSTWKFSPIPNGSGGGGLFDVTCITSTDCIAVGAPNTAVAGLADEWNGKTWAALQTPPGEGELESVSCVSATSCVAIGVALNIETGQETPLAESWNGRKWSLTNLVLTGGGAVQDELFSVSCGSATSCAAVGVSVSEEGIGSPLIETWNGKRWLVERSAADSPANLGLTGVSCTSSIRCMVTGYYFDRFNSPVAFSEVSNRSSWKSEGIPTPTGGAVLYGLQCSGPNACTTVGGGANGALAEGWNGNAWTVEAAVNPPSSGTSTDLNGVDCTTSSACTAVGDYTNNAGIEFTLAEAS
jgi:hypothetical protein